MKSKRTVDTIMQKIRLRAVVELQRLTDENIVEILTELKKRKKTVTPPCHDETEPSVKRIKFNDKGKEVLKLVLSREGESDKFKSQFKTTLYSRIVDESSDDPASPCSVTEVDSDSNVQNISLIGKSSDMKKISTLELRDKSIKDQELLDEKKDKPCNELNSLIGKIWVRDVRTMMTEAMLKRYYRVFSELNQQLAVKQISTLTNTQPTVENTQSIPINTQSTLINTQPTNQLLIKGNLKLVDIEMLYSKYFSKHVQDTIVIIANILNIISLSNRHHKARMDESFKKKTEAEKLKERCDANRIHERHKFILESQLKYRFIEVVSMFSDQDFDHAFQMFFLSVLTVLRVLDHPKFKKGSIFKNLVLLLWNSLRSCNLDNRRVFTMFRSKTFRPDCIELISLIEDSRESDPGIVDRMSMFFISNIDATDFQRVIEGVTSDTSADMLATLVHEASQNIRRNSKFKDPLKNNINSSANLETTTILTNAVQGSNEVIKHWVITKGPNGTYQPYPMTNENKPPRNTINDNNESISSVSPQLNSYYENFSNTLLKNVPDLMGTKPITTKINLASSTVTSGGSLPGKFVAYDPKNNTVKAISSSNIQRADGNTYVVKPYQLFRGQMRPMISQGKSNGIILAQQPKNTDGPVRCYARNCNEIATIMCSTCTSVKYCSHNCQRSDWYEKHINNCDRLQKLKMLQQKAQNS
ncbi:uncharacterized protein LOC126900299 isoform X2 [Daktulosphaira vitifoliae]|nr:uncharacterized protein LOC126900299 isoform X2 [Daktulosphaira vitifoliae]XP_050531878.1 uncharacterized protein LOC126900299 isoform X2 [Daktulosphaira vitifoliae]XP_050531879.1 uncharacterized protein LOC126900299 isoform X2 [Daktulosphaira vitifoliae]